MPVQPTQSFRLTSLLPALFLLQACDLGEMSAALPQPSRSGERSATIPALARPNEREATPQKLSQFDNARDVDLAVGPDGALHVVFTERKYQGNTHVYYRISRDGGASWSEIENLSEVDPARPPGIPHVAVDGENRVYVIWKAMVRRMPWDSEYRVAETAEGDHQTGLPHGAPLVYRVQENGRWSTLQAIDTRRHVVSWFPSVSPDGRLHVVWSEQVKADDGYQTTHAARILQTNLVGARPGPARTILDGAPDDPTASGGTQVFDNYHSLRGYVDAAGVARWVAGKLPATPKSREELVVYWDGQQEQTLFEHAQYGPVLDPTYAPPSLVVDEGGRSHVLVQDVLGDRPGLLDLSLDGTKGPAVYRMSAPKGEFKTYQAVQGSRGQLAVLMNMKAAETTDLFVSTFEGGRWSVPLNVTGNASRDAYKEIDGGLGNSAQVSTRYEPGFGAGVFDASGRLALVAINDERAAISSNQLGSLNGSLTNVSGSGMVNNPNVYFFRP